MITKFSVCVEMIFNDVPFLQRLEKVKETGVSAFEFWDWKNRNVNAINKKRKELGLTVSSFLIQPEPTSLVISDVAKQFYKSVKETLKVAQKLDCEILIAPVGLGKRADDLSREKQLSNALVNTKAVKSMLEDANVTMVIEPVNLIDHKSCFLSKSKEGFDLVRAIGSPNVRLLYDFYHQQISERNLIENIKTDFGLVGLFHIGDVPGRHQPGTGEINYKDIFSFLVSKRCDKYVSMEFIPTIEHGEAVRQTERLANMAISPDDDNVR